MRRFVWGGVLGLAIGVCAARGMAQVTLVEEGRGLAVIVLADRPSSAAREAAELLAAQVERVSGARLAVVREGALEGVLVADGRVEARVKGQAVGAFVLVGEGTVAGRLGATAEGLGPGGVRIRTFANAVAVLGPDDATPSDTDGTRYAAVTFLEEALGFRMLWPGELGLVAPPRRTVAVGPMDVAYTPVIAQRKIRNGGYSDRLQAGLDYMGLTREAYARVEAVTQRGDSRTPSWFAWQRLGGDMGVKAGHAFGYVWEKYGGTHQEWFAMQPNGSRDLSKLSPERARLCKSNMALIEALAADKIGELARDGGRGASLCPNDGGLATFCMCEACKRLDVPEGRAVSLLDNVSGPRRTFEYVSLTDRMVWFWNRLAERVAVRYPEARLAVYAYSCYKAPPLRERLHPNLVVGFVGMDYASDAARRQAREDWDGWAKAAGALYWRPNLLLFARREGTPALYAHKLGEDLARFAGRSLKGTDFDSCGHHWATEGLNYYVLARLLWNPAADVDALLEDYCRSGFGGGWRQVRQYFARVEAMTDEIAAGELPVTAPYTRERVAELDGLLAAAWAADGDETVRRRVAFLRRGLAFAPLQQASQAFFLAHPDKRLTAEEKARIMALQREKWDVMRGMFEEEPLAVNMPLVAWGSEIKFRKYGWKGAAGAAPRTKVEADGEGRVVPPPEE